MIWSFLRQHYTTDVLRMYYSNRQVGLTELFNDYSNFNRSGTNTYINAKRCPIRVMHFVDIMHFVDWKCIIWQSVGCSNAILCIINLFRGLIYLRWDRWRLRTPTPKTFFSKFVHFYYIVDKQCRFSDILHKLFHF